MSNQNYIEFKKERKVGEIITDTFGFIRNEFSSLIRVFISIVLPFLIIMLIASSAFVYFTKYDFTNFVGIGLSVFFFIISLVIAYVYGQAAVLYYIKSYLSNQGVIDVDEIKTNVKSSIGKFIGLGILVGLTIAFGMFLLLIPGLYVFVPLSIAFSYLTFTGSSVSEAYNNSFKLVRDNWWNTLGCILLVGLLVGVLTSFFTLPASIYEIVNAAVSIENRDFLDPSIDAIAIVLNLISTIAQYLLNIITVVATAFIYFDLDEQTNKTGALETIDGIGEVASDEWFDEEYSDDSSSDEQE